MANLANPLGLGVWIGKNTNAKSILVDRDGVFRGVYVPKATAKPVPMPRNDLRIGVKVVFFGRISKISGICLIFLTSGISAGS